MNIDPIYTGPVEYIREEIELDPIDPVDQVALDPEIPHQFYISADTSSGEQFSSTFSPLEIDAPESLRLPSKLSFQSFLIQFVETVSAIEGEHSKIVNILMESSHDNFSTNLEAHLENLQEIQKQSSSKDWWSFLRKLACNLLSAATVIIGASLISPDASTAAIIGGSALILSGGLSLVASTFFDHGKYKNVGMWMMVASSAVGVLGGALSLSSTFSFKDIIGKLVTVSLSVVANSSEIARQVHNYQLETLRGDNAIIRKQMEGAKSFSKQMQGDFERFTQDMTDATEETLFAAKRLAIAGRKITAQSGPGAAA